MKSKTRHLPVSNRPREINRRRFLALAGSATLFHVTGQISLAQSPSKIVVLTFDDAVKTQRTFVGPLLKELGFGATFFVCHRWMTEMPDRYMNWQDIAELHAMGFEIGNHTWTHPSLLSPYDAAKMPAELKLVETELRHVGVPKPTSFAWCGNSFSPESVQQLADLGYRLARRGMQPEIPYGQVMVGPTFDPQKHDRLLIPTTGDNYPGWTLEHFQQVAERAQPGQIVVFQFHGVPDPHPWVNAPQDNFRQYMNYLRQQGCRVIAFRELERFLPLHTQVRDPMLNARYPDPLPPGAPAAMATRLPTELVATRADLDYWLTDMIQHHYNWEEMAKVTGFDIGVLENRAAQLPTDVWLLLRGTGKIRVLPYPGGRHPRIGFLEGAVLPQRGTKASIFSPWDPASYVVVDLPEAIFSNLGLTFLAHTDVPTIWDNQNIWIENADWEDNADGSLTRRQRLPNKIVLGASVRPLTSGADLELWLQNNTPEKLTTLRTQVCVMLKGAPEFADQANENKIFRNPTCAVKSTSGDRWILAAWERCWHSWGNPAVPCMHADPIFPDCSPGEIVRVRGRLWFYAGTDIERELQRAQKEFSTLLGSE
jgi:peptidoglycan/xylan/chitin deacetylase (PgdA/CDA1 family)